MKKLYSNESGYHLAIGQVVWLACENLWVKIKHTNALGNQVLLRGANGEIDGWYDPAVIGAHFGDVLGQPLPGDGFVPRSPPQPGHAEFVRILTSPMPPHQILCSGPELDAIMAGLRLLAREVKAGSVKFADADDIGYIWTNEGEHDGLAPQALQDLATRINPRS